MARLAKDVLAEIPDQLLSFMKTRGIEPRPPLPVTSDSPSMSTMTATNTSTSKHHNTQAWEDSKEWSMLLEQRNMCACVSVCVPQFSRLSERNQICKTRIPSVLIVRIYLQDMDQKYREYILKSFFMFLAQIFVNTYHKHCRYNTQLCMDTWAPFKCNVFSLHTPLLSFPVCLKPVWMFFDFSCTGKKSKICTIDRAHSLL